MEVTLTVGDCDAPSAQARSCPDAAMTEKLPSEASNPTGTCSSSMTSRRSSYTITSRAPPSSDSAMATSSSASLSCRLNFGVNSVLSDPSS